MQRMGESDTLQKGRSAFGRRSWAEAYDLLSVVRDDAAADPPGLLPARSQMAFSLGWHIVLASFGVAYPLMIWVVHRRGEDIVWQYRVPGDAGEAERYEFPTAPVQPREGRGYQLFAEGENEPGEGLKQGTDEDTID